MYYFFQHLLSDRFDLPIILSILIFIFELAIDYTISDKIQSIHISCQHTLLCFNYYSIIQNIPPISIEHNLAMSIQHNKRRCCYSLICLNLNKKILTKIIKMFILLIHL